jgi:ABC-2 type transport system permease protein
MQKYIRIVISTMNKELKTTSDSFLPKAFSAILKIAAIAWIARTNGNADAITYLAFGAAMIMVWNGVITTGGWGMSDEIGAGTLDFALISQAPLPLLLFSKILATALIELPSAIISTITVFAVSGSGPQVGNTLMLSVSFLFAMIGAIIIGFFFSVLIVLVGGRAGFFMGIFPFGAVLGGFILPMKQMPKVIRGISMCVPSSWAMNGLWLSTGHSAGWGIIINLLLCLIISAGWFAVSYSLCKRGERQIIVNGDLGRQW